jgi:hypothetical protein
MLAVNSELGSLRAVAEGHIPNDGSHPTDLRLYGRALLAYRPWDKHVPSNEQLTKGMPYIQSKIIQRQSKYEVVYEWLPLLVNMATSNLLVWRLLGYDSGNGTHHCMCCPT